MRTCVRILLAAIFAYAVASAPTAAASDCPWITVANVGNPTIQSLGLWAVEQKQGFSFDRVESAKQQAIVECDQTDSCNFLLILRARNDDCGGPTCSRDDDRYVAVVYVEDKIHPKQLLSFNPYVPD